MAEVRTPRKYGLFIRVGLRWVRLFPKRAFRKKTAIRYFQSLLLELSFKGKHPELRPIKDKMRDLVL